jgi:hypothetical protein
VVVVKLEGNLVLANSVGVKSVLDLSVILVMVAMEV